MRYEMNWNCWKFAYKICCNFLSFFLNFLRVSSIFIPSVLFTSSERFTPSSTITSRGSWINSSAAHTRPSNRPNNLTLWAFVFFFGLFRTWAELNSGLKNTPRSQFGQWINLLILCLAHYFSSLWPILEIWHQDHLLFLVSFRILQQPSTWNSFH